MCDRSVMEGVTGARTTLTVTVTITRVSDAGTAGRRGWLFIAKGAEIGDGGRDRPALPMPQPNDQDARRSLLWLRASGAPPCAARFRIRLPAPSRLDQRGTRPPRGNRQRTNFGPPLRRGHPGEQHQPAEPEQQANDVGRRLRHEQGPNRGTHWYLNTEPVARPRSAMARPWIRARPRLVTASEHHLRAGYPDADPLGKVHPHADHGVVGDPPRPDSGQLWIGQEHRGSVVARGHGIPERLGSSRTTSAASCSVSRTAPTGRTSGSSTRRPVTPSIMATPVILEGILDSGRYGDMLRYPRLAGSPRSDSRLLLRR